MFEKNDWHTENLFVGKQTYFPQYILRDFWMLQECGFFLMELGSIGNLRSKGRALRNRKKILKSSSQITS